MKYYSHHIGDYIQNTRALSQGEHGAYRMLLDEAYSSENGIDPDEVYLISCAKTLKEKQNTDRVLKKFFFLENGRFYQKRVQEEVLAFREKSEKARASVSKRWSKEEGVEDENLYERNTNVSDSYQIRNTNHKPITNNHKPSSTITVLDGEEGSRAESAQAPPRVPAKKLIALYHEHCPKLPRVEILTDRRKAFLSSRWKENPSEEFWEEFFRRVGESEFLCGLSPPGNNREVPFRADFEWLIRPSNFVKVIEGKYDNRRGKDATAKPTKLQKFLSEVDDWAAEQDRLNAENTDSDALFGNVVGLLPEPAPD